jgi:hypothetical protein
MEPASSLSYYLQLQKQMSYSMKRSSENCGEQLPCKPEKLLRPIEEARLAGFTGGAEFATSQSRGERNLTTEIAGQWALIEMAEETRFDWPEFLPVERVKTGLMELALGVLLLAGVIAVGSLFILSPTFLS